MAAARLQRLASHVVEPLSPAASPAGGLQDVADFKMVFWGDEYQSGVFEQLREQFSHLKLVAPHTEDEAAEELKHAVAAWGRLSPSLLEAADGAPKLRWLHNPRSGPPVGYYFPALIEHPVQVTNARGMFNDQLPVHILTLILTLNRFMHLYRDQQASRTYKPLTAADGVTFVPLTSATVLLVGVGESGLEASRLLKTALNVDRVLGVDARRTGTVEWIDGPIQGPESIDSLLPEADFVVLTIPHTPETEGLFGAPQFAAMKRSACLINIARGPTVQLDALNDALRSGEIAGAGLDVFEVEPLPAEHGLWSAPGAVITPHVAVQQIYQPGTSRSGKFAHLGDERVAETTATNIRRFLKGEELVNVVDKRRWF